MPGPAVETKRLSAQRPDRQVDHFVERGGVIFLAARQAVELILLVALAQSQLQPAIAQHRSEEHTSELQSLMRLSSAVFCLKKKKKIPKTKPNIIRKQQN